MRKIILLVFCFYSWSLSAQNISISEICTKNNNIIPDCDFNQFVDWIELFNSTSSVINISGYFISDDPNEKSKWKFPESSSINPNDYILVWADDRNITIENHHTNFKLGSSNGFICISDADTNVVDIVEYSDQYEDISYGRENAIWVYFTQPTPGSINFGDIFSSSERESAPVFSLLPGNYLPNTQLIIYSDDPDATVYYTNDGSFPTENSFIYSSPIILNHNTIIRAKLFGNKLPSEEVSASYFINLNKDLPIVSLIVNPDFLWSDSIGIFNDNEIETRIEWERHSTIQYFESNEMKFEADNNIRLFGNTAYLLPQKSFAVFADDQINYQIFRNKSLSEFNSFILRSSSDDWGYTMFRDALTHTIISEKLDIDYQSYQPTVLYINGEYFGIFNLREKYNEDYLENNHAVDKNKIDFLNLYYPGLWYEVMAGSGEKYLQMLDYLYNNDITDSVVFDGISEYLDLKNYTHYIITQIYVGNGSFTHNIKTWRRNDTVDGFKWQIFDTDRGYYESWRNDFSLIYQADTVLKRLLDNVNYRNHFLQQTCSHINATFRTCFADNVIDSLKNNIASEMPYHISKWGPVGGIPSMEAWNQAVQVMHDFASVRKDTLFKHLNDFYNLDGHYNLHLKKTSPRCGKIYIEDVLIPYNDSIHEYFKNIPLTLVAKPNFGYSFIDWEGISTEDTINLTLSDDITINARFLADCNVPNIISEDMALLKDCSPYYFDQDLYVQPGATLFCEPGVEINFGQDVRLYVKGILNFIGTELEPITIQGENGVSWKYIEIDSGSVFLNHVEVYSGLKAIHFFNGSNLTIGNSVFYESGVNLDDLISGSSSVLEIVNCVFYGNESNTKSDCIDGDMLYSGVFSGNKFYNISDDCIDIGTNSLNIIIDHNEAYDSKSMGFSIGENSVASIFRNIVAHCNGGIQVHTGSNATIVNNTLYDNEVGIICYHYDNTPNSGGTAHVSNTIFSQNNADYTLQPNSLIDISYSLSDNSILPGNGNITEDPQFINPSEDNFYLKSTSPCIDAGDILSELDPDNTRTDIGALYFDQFNIVHENKQTVFIYPNPFNNKFNIRLINGETIGDVELYNQIGELVYTKRSINSPECTIEMGYKGIVLLKLTDNRGNCITTKLISK